MKKQYKFHGILLLVIAISALLFSSCEKQDSGYAIGDFIVSFGIVEKNIDSNNSLMIHLDNGDIFVPIASSPYLENLTTNQRVLVNFAPMDDKINTNHTKTIFGKVNIVQNLPFKNILQLTAANRDSLGKDPVNIRDSWVTGDSILTIDFTYYTQGSVHLINLANNPLENTTNKPVVLEFLHNARGDQKSYKTSGFVSFKLDPFKIAGQNKTDLLIRFTNYEGKQTDLLHTINY